MGAIAVPILPGKLDEWRADMAELMGPRAAEFRDLNKRHGLTQHRAFLTTSPDGGSGSSPYTTGRRRHLYADSRRVGPSLRPLVQGSHRPGARHRFREATRGPMPELVLDTGQ